MFSGTIRQFPDFRLLRFTRIYFTRMTNPVFITLHKNISSILLYRSLDFCFLIYINICASSCQIIWNIIKKIYLMAVLAFLGIRKDYSMYYSNIILAVQL